MRDIDEAHVINDDLSRTLVQVVDGEWYGIISIQFGYLACVEVLLN